MELLFVYLVIIISAVFHEYAHGWVAFRMGDPTAKNAGRNQVVVWEGDVDKVAVVAG